MIRKYLVICGSVLLCSYSSWADIIADSAIKDVTVFKDRAQITRTATVSLEKGSNTIQFKNLPGSVENRSLQVFGSGNATIMNVSVETENFKELTDEMLKELDDKAVLITNQINDVDDTILRLKSSKSFLDKITQKVTFTAEQESTLELDPAKWEQMLNLYDTRSEKIDQQIRIAETLKIDLSKELRKIQADIRAAGYSEQKSKKVAKFTVDAKEAETAEVSISYIVPNARWTPTYDVRVETNDRDLALHYYGNVSQSTGEDWENVNLTLSTANPQLGESVPELRPWRINQAYDSVSYAPKMELRKPILRSMQSNDMVEDVAIIDTTSPTAAIFDINGKSSIMSSKPSKRVAISKNVSDISLQYSSVPKIEQSAYLQAIMKNPNDYAILPGSANVFINGNFTTDVKLDFIAPNEKFDLPLGVDQNVKVERKFVKKFQSNEGITGRRIRQQFEYEITILNSHDTPETLIIKDQLPISESEKIKVQLVTPTIGKIENGTVSVDEDKFITWNLTLKPNEKVTLPFVFYVESDANVDIDGLRIY